MLVNNQNPNTGNMAPQMYMAAAGVQQPGNMMQAMQQPMVQ